MWIPILELSTPNARSTPKIESYGFQSDFGKVLSRPKHSRNTAGLDWGETTGIPSWLTTNVTS